MKTISIMLVDDQEMIRRGLRMLLDSYPDLSIVAEADDGDTALELLEHTPVDVVLMDIRMPRMSGVEATKQICSQTFEWTTKNSAEASSTRPKVLILTTFDLDEYAFNALKAGASGFILKDTPVEQLVNAITHVHAGDAVVAPSTTRRLLNQFTAPPIFPPIPKASFDSWLSMLTPREKDVFTQIAQGLSNSEIAERLFLTTGTVKIHVGRILTKLGLRDRVQAVVLAYESGYVAAGTEQSLPYKEENF